MRLGVDLPAATGPRHRLEPLAERRVSRVHIVWIAAWSGVAVLGTVAAPALLGGHELLLMALAPRAAFVALAAHHVHLVPFVLVGLVRLSITDPSYFVIGRQVRARGVDRPTRMRWLDPGRRVLGLVCRSRTLAGAVLFLRPNAKYVAVAGHQGVPAGLVAAANVSGTLAYLFAVWVGVALIT